MLSANLVNRLLDLTSMQAGHSWYFHVFRLSVVRSCNVTTVILFSIDDLLHSTILLAYH